MNKTLFITVLFGVTSIFAQNQPDSLLIKEIPAIQQTLEKQQQEIEGLNSRLNNQQTTINQQQNAIIGLTNKSVILENTNDSLTNLIKANQSNITIIADDLETQIQETGEKTDTQIAQLDSSVEKNRLYWIIATLITFLLGGLVYWLLGKRIKSSKTDVETQIKNTKAALEEESVKLDNKLVEVLETQLKLQQERVKSQPVASNEKADHSLALKVADEIVRMQKNISKMDEETKGLKPLIKGIERIQNNFAANGYEMINLLNTEYDERNNIDVINFITDENLAEGKRIISAVIKPQVNFNGILIQRAQVDVSQN